MKLLVPVIASVVAIATGSASSAIAEESPVPAIPDGSVIGEIRFERGNIFDLDNPRENNALYRLANRLHVLTRESTLERQLLFEEGDVHDARLLAESERILRRNKYLYDASIKPELNGNGTVDVTVSSRDVWTLTPEIKYERGGGEDTTVLGIEESNLFGRGQNILLIHSEDVDRRSNTFAFSARQLGDSWVGLNLGFSDSLDGHSYRLDVNKPFHSLDARRSGGFGVLDDDRSESLYTLGDQAAEYQKERRNFSAFAGWSRGLRNNWVRRWRFGAVYDDNQFSNVVPPELPQLIPDDRKLVYPFVAVDILEDRFEKASNSDQIERSEDFYLGTRYSMSLGWANESFGADRNAIIYSLAANHAFGSLQSKALFLSATANGRVESGDSANLVNTFNGRFYWRQSDKLLFFALIESAFGNKLDMDNPIELGGDTGLRGYPLRYQQGERRFLVTVEQRYFTNWYPFNFVRVGGAIFFDAGRVGGDDPLASENLGWLKDVGVGLRLAPTRLGTRKVYHIDIAFPLDGDPSIDNVQISAEAKFSF